MRDFFLYLLYRVAVALIAAIPAGALFRLGTVLGFGAWLILPHYRRLALHNQLLTRQRPPRVRLSSDSFGNTN